MDNVQHAYNCFGVRTETLIRIGRDSLINGALFIFMKQAKSMQNLMREAALYQRATCDLVAPTKKLHFHDDASTLSGSGFEGQVSDHAFGQMCRSLKVPTEYMLNTRASTYPFLNSGQGSGTEWIDKSRANLVADHLNSWLQHNDPRMQLVRGIEYSTDLDGNQFDGDEKRDWRAYLSNHYFAFDSADMLEQTLQVCREVKDRFGQVVWASGDISQDSMKVKLVFPEMQLPVRRSKRVGDVVQWGLYLNNNEVGLGTWGVRGFVEFLVCTNGMVSSRVLEDRNGKPLVMNRRHVGPAQDITLDVNWDTETRALQRKAQLSLLQDTVRHILRPEVLESEVQVFDRAASSVPSRNQWDTVERLAKPGPLTGKAGLSESETNSIFNEYLEADDRSQFGLAQAICSHNITANLTYARATEFEHLAYNVIALPTSQWERYARAA